MKKEKQELLDILTKIAREFSPDTVESLAAEINNLENSSEASKLNSWASTQKAIEIVDKLTKLWSSFPEVDPKSLSLSLLTARNIAEKISKAQTLELLWTGPRADTVPVRRTGQALLEVINTAKKEIIIVSFFAYKVDNIVKALLAAISRGVEVKMILELDEDAGGKLSFNVLQTMKKAVPEAKFYYWPIEKRRTNEQGKYGSLHVKCAIADVKKAFISSANLSDYALALNMELGVLVKGGDVPKRISAHFRELINMKTIVQSI